MGSYIAAADIYDVFGQDNIAVWSNLSGGSTVDDSRISRAIAVAEEDVENRFRSGKYALPFSPIPEVVKNWCAILAGLWLFESRPLYKRSDEEDDEAGFSRMRKTLDTEINFYTSGQRRLAANLANNSSPTAPVAV